MPVPSSVPMARTSGITRYEGQWLCWVSAAHSMVVIATTAPTDRSMPPVRITNVIPTASTIR